MSNITIQPTKFVNVRTGENTLGVRVYDDYGQSYDNTWESIPDDDHEILKIIIKSDDKVVRGMMEFLQEDQKSIDIGGAYYSWDEIKYLFLDDEEMVDDGMLKCEKCGKWIDEEDAISQGEHHSAEKWCPECDAKSKIN